MRGPRVLLGLLHPGAVLPGASAAGLGSALWGSGTLASLCCRFSGGLGTTLSKVIHRLRRIAGMWGAKLAPTSSVAALGSGDTPTIKL
eukprot:3446051-Pyramimonas_sp.AAC.1